MGAFTTWLNGLTSKTTPVAADELYLRDSEAAGASKKLTWANLKAAANVPGGSTLQVQYNNAGALGGTPNLQIESDTLITMWKGHTGIGTLASYDMYDRYVDASNNYGMRLRLQNGYGSFVGFNVGVGAGALQAIDVGVSSVNVARFAGDSITLYGTIPIRAGTANALDIGQSSSRFRTGYFNNMNLNGNLATGIAAKTGNYTLTANDGTVEVDATSGACTQTLPAVASTGGRIYIVKKTDSSGNAVTVDANASETIDGATTVSLASQWSTLIIQANAAGTAWLKLAGI